jgi:cobalt-zinc-cadmium efflux system outer membrane protein
MRSLPTLSVALALVLAPALGAQDTRAPLTARGAVALARMHHPALAAASGRRLAAVGRARLDGAWPAPALEWRRENMDSPLDRDEFVTVSLPLALTGRWLAARQLRSSADARARLDSAVTARDVEIGAARAYWRAALAAALLDAAVDHRTAAESLGRCETDRAREGAVAEVVTMRMSVETERARLAEATARAELRRAMGELARAVGVSVDALPPVAPATVVDAALPAPPDRATVETMALARRDVAATREGVREARLRLSAERRGSIPDVVVQAGTKRTAGYATRTLGLALPLPILDSNAGARQRATGELRMAEAELRTAELAARADAAASLGAYQELLAARSSGVDSLAARAEDVARIIEAAYGEGAASLLEVLEARRARADARAAALRWAVELRLARLDLDRALGAPLLDSPEAP